KIETDVRLRVIPALPPRFAGNQERDIDLQPAPRVEGDIETFEGTDVAEEERHVSAHAEPPARFVARWKFTSQLVNWEKRFHDPPANPRAGLLGLALRMNDENIRAPAHHA